MAILIFAVFCFLGMVGLFFIWDKVQRFSGSKVRREATASAIAGPSVDKEAAEPGAAEPGAKEPAIFCDGGTDSDGDAFEEMCTCSPVTTNLKYLVSAVSDLSA